MIRAKSYLTMLLFDILAWIVRVDNWSELREQSAEVQSKVHQLTDESDTHMLYIMAIIIGFGSVGVALFSIIFVGFYLQVS